MLAAGIRRTLGGYGPAVGGEHATAQGRDAGRCVIAPHGELEAHTYQEFSDELLAVRAGDVIVDLTRVTFIDSLTLGVIVQASKRAASRGDNLTVVVADSHIRKVLEVTGLGSVLRLESSFPDASV
jgi:anti-sigma B factor antagonist